MTISVLMSTYYREKPEYLDSAIKSIWTDQTRKPDEIVLIKDGNLTPELDEVICKWKEVIGDIFIVVANEENMGLAFSLNKGLEHIHGDLIARMDSDDISCPDRFRLQEEYLKLHPDVDILGTGIREFNDNGTLNDIRLYPITMNDIKARIHRLNPVAHPSVMIRKEFFDAGFRYSGKYYLCEDITLWFNAVIANRIINNLPDVLLKFRRNSTTIGRRKKTVLSEFRAYNNGIYNLYGLFTSRYVFSVLRLVFRLMPIGISNTIYKIGGLRNKLSR